MAEAVTSMKTNASPRSLDGPPPLPAEATKRSNLMGGSPGGNLGAAGGDPMVRTLMLTKQIENAAQELAAINPQMAGPLSAILNAFRQVSANSLAAQAPPLGGGGGMMAGPPMPPAAPPMAAGPPPGAMPPPGMQ